MQTINRQQQSKIILYASIILSTSSIYRFIRFTRCVCVCAVSFFTSFDASRYFIYFFPISNFFFSFAFFFANGFVYFPSIAICNTVRNRIFFRHSLQHRISYHFYFMASFTFMSNSIQLMLLVYLLVIVIVKCNNIYVYIERWSHMTPNDIHASHKIVLTSKLSIFSFSTCEFLDKEK